MIARITKTWNRLIPFSLNANKKSENNKMPDRMINQFMERVKIDSESGNGVQMIEYLLKGFTMIGAQAEKDSCGILIVKLSVKS